MSTFHAVVWMDHSEAHVVMFDREHMEAQRVKSRSHHKHQGKNDDTSAFFADTAKALEGTHEVLLCGPGLARNQCRDWCSKHNAAVSAAVVDSVAADHPPEPQLVVMACQYFNIFVNLSADPSLS